MTRGAPSLNRSLNESMPSMRVVTVEVAHRRYDVAIEDIRMLESDPRHVRQRVQSRGAKSFNSAQCSSVHALGVQGLFTKGNVATVVGTITIIVTIIQQIHVF